MNAEQAIQAAQQIGIAPGDHITLQSLGQINHPHGNPPHVDGWAVQNNNGNYEIITKLHG